MKTSRQRILEFIQTRQVVTAIDLSMALKMTEANARHHLNILKEQGVVEIVGQRPPQGKGRPSLLYSPSKQALGHNLDLLTSALLKEAQSPAQASQGDLLQRTAKRLASGNGMQDTKNPNLTQRLYQAVQRLNGMHYHARWEAHAEAPRIILGHCPYTQILANHPEICQLDQYLLEGLLGVNVKQVARLAQDARGRTYCMFQLVHSKP